MAEKISCANISFDTLKESNEFLDLILSNISSCVLLLDKDMELYAYNDPIKTIFSNKPDEHLLYVRCGEAIGCAFTVEEEKQCGTTSKCKYCNLRESALISYTDKKPVYKQKLSREFYTTTKNKQLKHLQFSTRPFYYNEDYYIILIIEDVTNLVEFQNLISKQNEQISSLLGKN